METQKDLLSTDTLAAIRWLGMPEETPFPLKQTFAPEPHPRAETLAQVELLPAEVRQWDDVLHAWTQARCAWRERSWGSLMRLYIDHVEHAHQRPGILQMVKDVETFRAILMALGFQIENGFVYGLLPREDADAAQWKPETAKKRGTK